MKNRPRLDLELGSTTNPPVKETLLTWEWSQTTEVSCVQEMMTSHVGRHNTSRIHLR